MPTFLGNHDMGRIGHFLQRVDQPDADDAELLARSRLAHALMSSPAAVVVYYGDEQGFTGDGGDKDAREDMFANEVPVYADNDLIGTDETTSDDNFDRDHPLYRTIADYSRLYDRHPALRSAPRSTATAATALIYDFAIDRDQRVEYVVALNTRGRATAESHLLACGRVELVSPSRAMPLDGPHRDGTCPSPCPGCGNGDLQGRRRRCPANWTRRSASTSPAWTTVTTVLHAPTT